MCLKNGTGERRWKKMIIYRCLQLCPHKACRKLGTWYGCRLLTVVGNLVGADRPPAAAGRGGAATRHRPSPPSTLGGCEAQSLVESPATNTTHRAVHTGILVGGMLH